MAIYASDIKRGGGRSPTLTSATPVSGLTAVQALASQTTPPQLQNGQEWTPEEAVITPASSLPGAVGRTLRELAVKVETARGLEKSFDLTDEEESALIELLQFCEQNPQDAACSIASWAEGVLEEGTGGVPTWVWWVGGAGIALAAFMWFRA